MIASVHIVDVGTLRAPRLRRRINRLSGRRLGYAEGLMTTPLSKSPLPAPKLGRVGMIAAWPDDQAIDDFLAADPVGRELARGWHVRLDPVRVSGAWSAMPGLPRLPLPVEDEEPVAVLTLGRLRLRRSLAFLRSAGRAEAEVLEAPALVASTGLARPPHVVSTFSLWRSAAAMKAYSYSASGAHQGAVQADRTRPFHHESAFIRFRPYASQGHWDGVDPLAALLGTA